MIKGSLSHASILRCCLLPLALAGAAGAAFTIRQNSGPINGKGRVGSDQKNASVPPR